MVSPETAHFLLMYATSFYGAACYVFAYDWELDQPVVHHELPIGSKYSHTQSLAHTVTRCRTGYPSGLPKPTGYVSTVIGHIPLPARTNLCLWSGRFSHTRSILYLVPQCYGCPHQARGATLRRLTFPMPHSTCPSICQSALEL